MTCTAPGLRMPTIAEERRSNGIDPDLSEGAIALEAPSNFVSRADVSRRLTLGPRFARFLTYNSEFWEVYWYHSV